MASVPFEVTRTVAVSISVFLTRISLKLASAVRKRYTPSPAARHLQWCARGCQSSTSSSHEALLFQQPGLPSALESAAPASLRTGVDRPPPASTSPAAIVRRRAKVRRLTAHGKNVVENPRIQFQF